MRIAAIIPEFSKNRCFTPATWKKLESLGEFVWDAEASRKGSGERLLERCAASDVLVTGWGTRAITQEILEKSSSLKLIAHSAGSVSFVDILAWKRGVAVTNVMPVMALGVAEFTVTCILSGLRRFDGLLMPERFDSNEFFSVPKVGFMLRGKKVGLVGLGIIGREVVNLLRPFGCQLIVHDPYIDNKSLEYMGVKPSGLDELMESSDVVSLHAPGTLATANLIDERRLRMMKPGSILVNTARGILVDHDALGRVAGEGKIGVYLDVTRPEPLPAEHPLLGLKNVVITPHVAGPTVEGWPMMGDACVDDVERFIKGEPVKYPVLEHHYANQSL